MEHIDFHQKLRDYIAKNGIQQRVLAEKLHVSESQLNRWLSGRVGFSNAWKRILTDFFNKEVA
jgi:transcriptional regulator with XRE-family HTH domain